MYCVYVNDIQHSHDSVDFPCISGTQKTYNTMLNFNTIQCEKLFPKRHDAIMKQYTKLFESVNNVNLHFQ